jgi:heat shock protein HspQ
MLQKTMPEKILLQNTNTTEHYAYVTENHTREEFATEHQYHNTMNMLQKTMSEKKLQQNTNTTGHHEYVTENHARDDFATEHQYHRTP